MQILFFSILKFENSYRPLQSLSYIIECLKDFSIPKALQKLFLKVQKNTLVNYARIKSLANICQIAIDIDIKGSFVECGVWKGGCSAVMAYIAKENAHKNGLRDVYLYDSFQGLPQVTAHDGIGAHIFSDKKNEGKLETINKNVASEKDVTELFINLGLLGTNVHIVKGWFQESLPINKDKMGSIAVLRLDGDWYESTKVCLENLYDKVSSGGFIILDDYYFWEGCKKATDEFISSRKLEVKLVRTDFSGVYFVKP